MAMALLADDDIGPEPVQRVFFVEIRSAPPRVPGLGSEVKLWRGIGGVLQVAPLAARKVIERFAPLFPPLPSGSLVFPWVRVTEPLGS